MGLRESTVAGSVNGRLPDPEGAAIDVIEDLTGQLPTSEFAVVIDRGWREIQAVVTGILGHNVLCSTRQQWPRRWLTTSR